MSNLILLIGHIINFLYHNFVLINDFNREMGCQVRKTSCDSANTSNTSLSCCALKEKLSSKVNKIDPVIYKNNNEKPTKEMNNLNNDSKRFQLM